MGITSSNLMDIPSGFSVTVSGRNKMTNRIVKAEIPAAINMGNEKLIVERIPPIAGPNINPAPNTALE
jgi:hypothetical protein